MVRAKFNKGFNADGPVPLYYIVSMSNANQTGAAFEAFIDLVNRHKARISKLIIVTTGWLHRHYVGKKQAEIMSKEWSITNQAIIEKLNQDIELEITDWKEVITGSKGYDDAKGLIKNLYREDETFQTLIDNLAENNKSKATKELAKAYALEDTLAALFISGYVAYPAPTPNPAIDYIMKKFQSQLKYVPYAITKKPKNISTNQINNLVSVKLISNTPDEARLMKTCFKAVELMDKFGIHGSKQQEGFFKDFLFLIYNFPKERSLDNGTPITRPTT